MKVNTINFGELEVEEDGIFMFPQGIPGFEELRKFIILQPDENVPFSYLQSVEQEELSLIITNPFLFYPDYELNLSENTQTELQIKEEEDVMVWSTITIKDNTQEATINLLAPIIINVKQKRGKQIILNDSQYQTKHRLIPEDKIEAREVR